MRKSSAGALAACKDGCILLRKKKVAAKDRQPTLQACDLSKQLEKSN